MARINQQLEDDIRNLYQEVGGSDVCIQPFIGEAFAFPSEKNLRVMAFGINSYIGADEWGQRKPKWFRDWYAETEKDDPRARGFFSRTKRELDKLCHYLVRESAGSLFRDYSYALPGNRLANHYLTDVVKAYIQKDTGKCATQLDPTMTQEHMRLFSRELSILAKHGCFPHVIVAFWRSFWPTVWQTFHEDTKYGRPRVAGVELLPSGFSTCGEDRGRARHHVNRIDLLVNDHPFSLLLVSLTHPSRPGRNHAKWWIEDPAIRELIRKD